jgi:glutamine amidotransferase
MSGPLCVIPDYGCGNLRSILRMVEKVDGRAVITGSPADLLHSDRIILAGVGAFDHGMQGLTAGGWVDALAEASFHKRIPILGICLGMQLMCRSSDEGELAGLGWFDAVCRKFDLGPESQLKTPHMGWNSIVITRPSALIPFDRSEQRFYFVHSYHVVCNQYSDVLATASHGYTFTAAICRENVFGVQFHPEKSHRFGMALMKRFLES